MVGHEVTFCSSLHLNRSPLFHDAERKYASTAANICQSFLPMGLLSLKRAVEEAGCSARILEINKHVNNGTVNVDSTIYNRWASLALQGNPRILAFMVDCDSFHHTLQMTRVAKARSPDVSIVLGGVHPTMLDVEILESEASIDFIYRGEGEIYFPKLVSDILHDKVPVETPNTTYRFQGETIRNPEGPLIKSLDELPFPFIDDVLVDAKDDVWVEVGRGCPFKCNFCVTAPFWHRLHRVKTPERIVKELKYFEETIARGNYNLTHDLFTTNRKWVLQVCDAFCESGLKISWSCSSRTDTIDEEMIERMAAAGCNGIYFGIETGTDKGQDGIDKNLDLAKGRKVIEKCIESNIAVTVGLIAGLPQDDEESLRGTMKEFYHYLLQEKVTAHIFGYAPYKGSPSFKDIEGRIVLEQRFIDFPLPFDIREKNATEIAANRQLHSRWGRILKTKPVMRAVRVLEEYAPVIGVMPRLYEMLAENGADHLDLVKRWADWLTTHGKQKNQLRAYDYDYGSVEEFLQFLEHFVQDDPHWSSPSFTSEEILDEIGSEKIREAFRKFSMFALGKNVLPSTKAIPRSELDFYVNPTIRFLENARTGEPKGILLIGAEADAKTIDADAYGMSELREAVTLRNDGAIEGFNTTNQNDSVLRCWVEQGIIIGEPGRYGLYDKWLSENMPEPMAVLA